MVQEKQIRKLKRNLQKERSKNIQLRNIIAKYYSDLIKDFSKMSIRLFLKTRKQMRKDKENFL